ncbi:MULTISPECIES: TIGR03759 family integrating conjugative element protein [Entomomonas]|uniref:TIGR03759 family integrating conjugative element protein n=1 Tax=Entomomonas asaccharolytica TaxID=2785331 RepID=A0A974NHT1_9GAMM|nr:MULTISPECIES: TIGR03759 family integrating conjugative element protein [Entomomonas]QQP86836.1 TIGR03759 family integrating conjugative element protein [Entomomonas asaccharolytica]UYZ83546.1 TIGR03759 family integrating conjugative element protein [Entomomonas sp. E2T0]
MKYNYLLAYCLLTVSLTASAQLSVTSDKESFSFLNQQQLQGQTHAETKQTQSQITNSLKQQYAEQAAQWSLTEQEWEKFEAIKKGPRGYWSPNLDPLTALGMEAETDEERQRYAETQVKMEVARVERELAYQRAYNAAFKRLYPNMLPVQGMGTTKPLMSTSTATSNRLTVFVKQDCKPCEAKVKTLQKAGTGFDIYMVDSNNKDDVIRKWANKVGIQPQLVHRKQITLNHGEKLWKQVGRETDKLPITYLQANGQLVRQN